MTSRRPPRRDPAERMDIDAPPPGTGPSALVLFGTNQAAPAQIAAGRYHRGLAPLIIATGGIKLYAIGWEPVYAGTLVTRDNWPSSPDGCRRVIRESQEVPRRVTEGSYLPAVKKDGAWSLCLKSFRLTGTGASLGRGTSPAQTVPSRRAEDRESTAGIWGPCM